ncbi:cell envelope integrity protein CreD [Sphingorhabdus sp. 109]|jgi:inner membrane protein|uniref:cell envelope integrity protein CreD n=1 Tax=Sphingorhabdus sp. 109 TaxID=2653173 RepID=UPI0012F11BFE|nr:cell envelope integrity protein CreD [Sphingorhabdus sp. 109]VWX57689.1 Inner membrane protein CreD [Sphingorhabdus sp. 109]
MTEETESRNEFDKAERSPGAKFLLVLLMGFLLTIPLFATWLLVYDRQSQSETAQQSIVTGWGGEQVFAGPKLVLPYTATVQETVEQDGKSVTRSNEVTAELFLAPETVTLDSDLKTQSKKRAIYEVVVYDSHIAGSARFRLPDDFERNGISTSDIDFTRAELRFGLSDARGLAGDNNVTVNGEQLTLKPGRGLGETGNSGFFAWVDASRLMDGGLSADFTVRFKGNQSLTVAPHAGLTEWTVRSKWPHPSFTGGFLPETEETKVTAEGFEAKYAITNLALGSSLVALQAGQQVSPDSEPRVDLYQPAGGAAASASVNLIQPVDLYGQVDRAAKYGFLIIGFTFVAFLLFDLIGGVRISSVQYILIGAALVLFFVLLLAFAEIIGFALAFIAASAATIGLITAYSASVLSSWRSASLVGGLLAGLYGAIYILLSLQAYSLLIGSLLIFAALAGVMFVTRRLDWSNSLGRAKA